VRTAHQRPVGKIAPRRAHGRKGGRTPMQPNEPKVVLAKKLYCDKTISLRRHLCHRSRCRTRRFTAISLCGPTRKTTANVAPVDDRRFLTGAILFTAFVFGRCDSFSITTTSSRSGRCSKNVTFRHGSTNEHFAGSSSGTRRMPSQVVLAKAAASADRYTRGRYSASLRRARLLWTGKPR
jgi:hypothetical protein